MDRWWFENQADRGIRQELSVLAPKDVGLADLVFTQKFLNTLIGFAILWNHEHNICLIHLLKSVHFNTQYMTNSTLVSPVKMEYG